MDEQPLRLLIADDEPLAAERLQLLLAQIPDVDLVGTASDGEGAVRMADALGPDPLLADIEMPAASDRPATAAKAGRRKSRRQANLRSCSIDDMRSLR
jgi:two-component system response regulator AlgR